MRIGVLALQGNFREHIATLAGLGVEAVEVRKPEQLEGSTASSCRAVSRPRSAG